MSVGQITPPRVICEWGVPIGQFRRGFVSVLCVCLEQAHARAWEESVDEYEKRTNVRSALAQFTPRPNSHKIPFSYVPSFQARHWDGALAIYLAIVRPISDKSRAEPGTSPTARRRSSSPGILA